MVPSRASSTSSAAAAAPRPAHIARDRRGGRAAIAPRAIPDAGAPHPPRRHRADDPRRLTRANRRLRAAQRDPGAPARRGRLSRRRSTSARDQKGNNDLLNLTRPELVARDRAELRRRRRRHPRHQHLQRQPRSARPITARSIWSARSTSPRRGSSARSPTRERQDGRSAGSPARSGRPTRRCRCRPTSTIPAIARSISTRSPTSMSSRSRRWSKAASTSS